MTDSDEQQIRALEEARCRAIAAADGAALRELLHPDYLHVTGRGSTMDRDRYIEWIGDLPRRHERHDLRIQVFGDTAVVHGPLTNHLGDPADGGRVLETFVTQVAHRDDGVWCYIAFHITPVT